MKSWGEYAYSVYGDNVGWVNFKGDPMPEYSELPEKIRNAWEAVGRRIAHD